MDARDFLEFARLLFALEKTPRAFRTTIGRAYYAAFNVAAEFLNSHGIPLRDDREAHQHAYEYLNNCKERDIEKIASKLDQLKKDRNRSDYRLDNPSGDNETIVTVCLELATEI